MAKRKMYAEVPQNEKGDFATSFFSNFREAQRIARLDASEGWCDTVYIWPAEYDTETGEYRTFAEYDYIAKFPSRR